MLHALLLSGFITAQGADVVTSLKLPAPLYREVNPVVPSRPVPFVALKASLTTAIAVAGWKMRHTHPKLAVIVFAAGIASGSIAATMNARILAQRR